MEQQTLFKVRDKRKKGWFFMDNEYLNGYAKIFGAVGTAVYVSLCRHADIETQKCFPSLELISNELNISRPTIIKYIKLFEEYQLLEKIKGKRNSKQQWINNEYILLDKSEWVKNPTQVKPFNTDSQVKPFSNPSKTDSDTQVKPFNTKETHIKETHIKEATQSVAEKIDINKFIELFKAVNPSYERLYANKTQRAAVGRLIKKHGEEKLTAMIEVLPKINAMAYMPATTTPYELEANMGKIKAKIEQNKLKGAGKYKKIEII